MLWLYILNDILNDSGAVSAMSTHFAILTFFPGWTTNRQQLKCKFSKFLLKSSILNCNHFWNVLFDFNAENHFLSSYIISFWMLFENFVKILNFISNPASNLNLWYSLYRFKIQKWENTLVNQITQLKVANLVDHIFVFTSKWVFYVTNVLYFSFGGFSSMVWLSDSVIWTMCLQSFDFDKWPFKLYKKNPPNWIRCSKL